MMLASVKTALALAALLTAPAGFAADAAGMSKDDQKAARERIEARYESDRAACARMDGNAKDVCAAEARAKQKVARAELDADVSGKAGDRHKAAKVKADEDHAVAKAKCADKAVADTGMCKKEAKAAHDKAMAEVKAEQAREKAEARAAGKSGDRKAGDLKS